jgi:hypothetical protein
LVLLVTAACASLHRPNLPWRTEDMTTGASANPERTACTKPPSDPMRLTLDRLPNRSVQASVRCASDEHYLDLDTRTELDLHVVEFDDQGRFWNREQLMRALDNVRAARKDEDVLVITFFHGWFNNGDVCNGKLSCFRELLSLIAQAERSDYRQQLDSDAFKQGPRKPRRVIGIFGAWRGETLAVEGAKFITFWGRKSTAHTIGENGAVTELIASLFGIVHPPATGGKVDLSSLVVIGHSFGGALLMSTVGNELNRAAGEALVGSRGGDQVTVTNRMADLVVLINPAVEASRFDNLREASSTAAFSDDQVPVLLTLSSEADHPNKILFPIGQSIAFVQKAARSREQWQGMIQSLGTFRANHTHQLIARGSAPPNHGRIAPCQCEAGIADYRDVLLDALLNQVRTAARPDADPGALSVQAGVGSRREYLYSRLEPTQDTGPNNPFFMVHVDDEIIGGHSDIFNPRTVDFLLEFLLRSEAKRASVRQRLPQPALDGAASAGPSKVPAQPPGSSGEPCFEVEKSPDGPVSIVRLAGALPRSPRLVGISYSGDASSGRSAKSSIERFVDADEREFAFTFTQEEGTYTITALDPVGVKCSQPVDHRVPSRQESTPTQGSIVIGMADGFGLQLGGTLQLSRFVLEGSFIKKAGSARGELTSDVGLGYRGTRGVVGAGHRWRHDFDLDQVTTRNLYTHFTLELPGVRFLKHTWSSWMGLEFTPVEWQRERDRWEWDPSFAVRFQIRLPREHWLGQ